MIPGGYKAGVSRLGAHSLCPWLGLPTVWRWRWPLWSRRVANSGQSTRIFPNPWNPLRVDQPLKLAFPFWKLSKCWCLSKCDAVPIVVMWCQTAGGPLTSGWDSPDSCLLTRDWQGGAIFCPHPSRFSAISHEVTKRSSHFFLVPSKPSVWYILTKGKLFSSDRSTINDVRVTSCFPELRQK